MTSVAALVFLLNPILWASYYAVIKGALDRFEPAVFAALDMLVVLPCGLVVMVATRSRINAKVVGVGVFLGSMLAPRHERRRCGLQ